MLYRRSAFLFALCTLLAPWLATSGGSTTHAQGGTVALRCRAGFGDLSPRSYQETRDYFGDWLPFRVEVVNFGAALDGVLVVRAKTTTGRTLRFEKRVSLPTGARQSHEILAHVAQTGEAPTLTLEVGGEALEMVPVALSSGSGASEVRIGVVDRDQTALNDISSVQIDPTIVRVPFAGTPPPAAKPAASTVPPPPAPMPQQSFVLKPVVIPPEDLPHSWLGYGMLDAIVLNDAPVSSLDEEQVIALRRWVAGGGMLVVAGGADFPGLRRLGLDALVPVGVAERRTIAPGAPFPSLYGSLDSSAGLVFAVGAVRSGAATLLSMGELPAVAELAYGAGRVRFVAVDPKLAPLRGWAGSPALWTDVVWPVVERRTTAQPYGYPYAAFSDRRDMLLEMADLRAPFVGYYFLYLFVYLVAVGPLNYLVLRWRGRLELAWVTIPALVLLFTLGTIVVARIVRGGRSVVISSSVDQYYQREGVSTSRSQVLVVPSSKDTYRLTLPAGSAAGDMSADFGDPSRGDTVLDETDATPVISAAMNTWEAHTFDAATASDEASPMRVLVTESGVEVTNTGADNLRNVAVVTRAGSYFVGDVPASATGRSTTLVHPPASVDSWYLGQLSGFPEAERYFRNFMAVASSKWSPAGEALPDDVFGTSSGVLAAGQNSSRPVALAFREGGRAVTALDAHARERRLSLVIAYLEGGSQ